MDFKVLLILLSGLLLVAECDDKEISRKAKDKKVTNLASARTSSKTTTKKPKQNVIKPKVKSPVPPTQRNTAESILSQVVQRGRFQQVGDTITVKAGQTLDLRCKGTSVRWNFPYYLQEDDEGRLSCHTKKMLRLQGVEEVRPHCDHMPFFTEPS